MRIRLLLKIGVIKKLICKRLYSRTIGFLKKAKDFG